MRIPIVPAMMITPRIITPSKIPLVWSELVKYSAGRGVGVPNKVVGVGIRVLSCRLNPLNRREIESLQITLMAKMSITPIKTRF